VSDDAIVPEEWVEAGMAAAWPVRDERGVQMWSDNERQEIRNHFERALQAVVPLAEQRATRSLLAAREETEGR
jgi:hypothetical protein